MLIVALCSPEQRLELGAAPDTVVFVSDIEMMRQYKEAAVWIDLMFEDNRKAHLQILEQADTQAVIVHSVIKDLSGLPPHFIRVNAWPTFLSGAILEGCGGHGVPREKVTEALGLLGKSIEWVPDVPGMVSARVIASIINEAYFGLSEGIATRQAIDTAMKLGTAYPYGPFEWAEKIGLERVASLLQELAQFETRYQPCALLVSESMKSEKPEAGMR